MVIRVLTFFHSGLFMKPKIILRVREVKLGTSVTTAQIWFQRAKSLELMKIHVQNSFLNIWIYDFPQWLDLIRLIFTHQACWLCLRKFLLWQLVAGPCSAEAEPPGRTREVAGLQVTREMIKLYEADKKIGAGRHHPRLCHKLYIFDYGCLSAAVVLASQQPHKLCTLKRRQMTTFSVDIPQTKYMKKNHMLVWRAQTGSSLPSTIDLDTYMFRVRNKCFACCWFDLIEGPRSMSKVFFWFSKTCNLLLVTIYHVLFLFNFHVFKHITLILVKHHAYQALLRWIWALVKCLLKEWLVFCQ